MNVCVVRGVSKLGKKQPGVCGPCQLGKELKGTHSVATNHYNKSIGVVTHGSNGTNASWKHRWKEVCFCMCWWFLIFTCVDFIKENSNTFSVFKKCAVDWKMKKIAI